MLRKRKHPQIIQITSHTWLTGVLMRDTQFLSESVTNANKLLTAWQVAQESIEEKASLVQKRKLKNQQLTDQLDQEQKKLIAAQTERRVKAIAAASVRYRLVRAQEATADFLKLDIPTEQFLAKAEYSAKRHISHLLFSEEKHKSIELSQKHVKKTVATYLEQKHLDEKSALVKETFNTLLEHLSSPPRPEIKSCRRKLTFSPLRASDSFHMPPELQSSLPESKVRQITQASMQLRQYLDEEHVGKILFFIYHMSCSQEYGSPVDRLNKAESLIRQRYKASHLHKNIHNFILSSRDTQAASIQRILGEYLKKKSQLEAILQIVADLPLQFDPNIPQHDVLAWQQTLDDGILLEIHEIVSTINNLFHHSSSINFVKALRDKFAHLASQRPLQQSLSLAMANFLKEDTLQILREPTAILEYLKIALIYNVKKIYPSLLLDNPLSFEYWLNFNFYNQPYSDTTTHARDLAQFLFQLQKDLHHSKFDSNQQSRLLHLLNIFTQHKNNFSELLDAIHESKVEGEFGAASFKKILDIQTAQLPFTTIHPECVNSQTAITKIPHKTPLRDRAILQYALCSPTVDQETLLEDIAPQAAADVKAATINPYTSQIHPQFQKMIQEELAPETPAIQHSKKVIAELTQRKQESDQGLAAAVADLSKRQVFLEQAKTMLLKLLREQVLIAFFNYLNAPKNKWLHNESGLTNARALINDICQPHLDLGTAIERMIQFLEQEHHLGDASFTTFLLAQIFSTQGGILRCSLPNNTFNSAERIYLFAKNATAAFAPCSKVLNEEIMQSTPIEEIPEKHHWHFEVLCKYYRNSTICHGAETALLQKKSIWTGLSGRCTVFGLVENTRLKAEKQGETVLRYFNQAIKGL